MVVRFSARALIAAVAIAFAAMTGSASAQQPNSVNPTASSVKEDQLLNALRSGDAIAGRISIPDAKANTLIQPGGRDWTAFHEVTLRQIGAICIIGMLIILAAFYMYRGKIRIDAGYSGIKILRFNTFERFMHWLTAGCFLVLALTGLNITFGKYLVLPLIGPDAFAGLTQWGKYAHNYLAFPFTLGILFMLVVWLSHNIPDKYDIEWLKKAGGLFTQGEHIQAKKFNAGQKLIFWSVIIGGGALAVTGLFLLFPFTWAPTIAGMQLTQVIHGVLAMGLVAIMIAHIYIGSVGMEGAFDAMGSGEVDLNWAREHHALWLEEEKPSARPVGAPEGVPAE